MKTVVKTKDGVETVDSTHTVERSESNSEEATGGAGGWVGKWFSLKRLLGLLLLVGVAAGLYFLLTSNQELSAEKVRLLTLFSPQQPFPGPIFVR